MAFGELRCCARTGCWGKNDPKASMGGFHKFRFQEMRGISLPDRRVRLRARYTALSGATIRTTAGPFCLETRDDSGNSNQISARKVLNLQITSWQLIASL